MAVLTIVVLWNTTWLWARGSLILNGGFAIAIFAAAVFAAGQLPPGLRNPLVLFPGLLGIFKNGWTVDGRSIRTRRPRTLRQGIPMSFFWTTTSEQAEQESFGVREPQREPELRPGSREEATDSRVTAQPPLTPIQQLLLGDQA